MRKSMQIGTMVLCAVFALAAPALADGPGAVAWLKA